ncbi:MAG: copper homeostasis protein CutC [Saprospiraceae bacterium]|nr:copper homeostasis protein CutC [Saprospiraceae bacterium]MCB9320568.1 copper homeostasis protein CutC [Lewinellaceae bacterium]
MKLLLEICAPSLRSAIAASRGGADRIELCSALEMGGLTPGAATLEMAVMQSSIPVAVLIRPRGGDFIYNETEKDLILKEIEFARSTGASGVVVGALQPDGSLDLGFARAMKQAAGTMEICFHRAFDQSRKPEQVLDELIALEYTRILTSGQQATAWEGRTMIKKLVQRAKGRINLMAGSGIQPDLIGPLMAETGVEQIHYSAKQTMLPPTGFRSKLSFSAPEMPPNSYWETDQVLVQKARQAINLLMSKDES